MKLIHKHSIINLKYRIRHEMFGFDTEIKYQITEMKIYDKTWFSSDLIYIYIIKYEICL